MAETRVSELSDFTGGMNTLVAPHLVSERESTLLVNVDIRLGSLASMPNLEFKDNLPEGGHFFEFKQVIYSYPNFRDNVIWDDKWYWSDGVETKKMLSDGTIMELGVKTPDTPVDINALAETGPHTGDFKYTYTFYSTQTGVESAPAPLQDLYVTCEAKKIELTNMEALPPEADRYRIYRIGAYLPSFTLVDTISVDTYIDDRGDTNIDGRLLKTMYCGQPPEGLENLTEMNGRFYGSVGNRLFYSALGNPDAWYISDYFVARDTIKGIAPSPGGILVMGQFFTMMFYGSQPNEYKVKLLSDQLGCIDKRSINSIGDSAIWLSHRSFVMCNGYDVTDITAYKIDYLRGIIPSGSAVDDSTYYMSFKPQLVPLETLYPDDELYPNLVEGTGGLDSGIIAMDFKRGNGYSYKIITYNRIISIGTIRGDVHVGNGAASTKVIECDRVMFPDCDAILPCSGFAVNRMSVYNESGLTKLQYLSPRLDDGSFTTLKEYDKVRVLYTGEFNVKVIFGNGEVVVEKDLAKSDRVDEFDIIGIPNKRNKSHYIRFAIEGVGTIHSLQYSWKPREVLN